MTYLLDTDIVVDWLTDALSPEFKTRFLSASVGISVVSLMELLEGTRDDDSEARNRLDLFRGIADAHSVSESTAFTAAAIRRGLRRRKAQVTHRALDILIAATAIEHNLILVTRNTRHFQDIDGLRILTNDPG